MLDDPAEALRGATLVLVATKRSANGAVRKLLAEHAPPGAPVLLCQNGLDAADDFASGPGGGSAALPRAVFQCIVTLNVVRGWGGLR